MGFLPENITLAYFAFLGDQPSALSLSVGFLELLAFTRYLRALSVGQEEHTSQRSNILIALRKRNIGRENSLAFFIEFDRCHLCPKCRLNLVTRWRGFLLRFFSTQLRSLA